MTDREVSAGTVIASATWGIALLLLALRWLTGEPALGPTCVTVAIAAATATIRMYFVNHSAMVRAAFELGRESVTPIRRR